jgi:superfamily II DNA helicase RecQ
MTDLIEQLQTLLVSNEPNYTAFRELAGKEQQKLEGKERARSHIPIRLSLALQGFREKRAGISDVAILLRQCIRAYEQRLVLPRRLWQQIQKSELDFGLRMTQEHSEGTIEVVADAWSPDWLPDTQTIDLLEERRLHQPIFGDGTLSAMTGWETYQSEAQKAAVSAFLFAAPGSTLLVNLPTGGGKSLCMLLPAWLESHGGRIQGGTTLVIVPTVSLAMDQKDQTTRFFKNAINEEFAPQSQTGDTSQERRSSIRLGLQNGTLPLLYLAPEALLNSELYQMCLDAAKAGTLRRFVIDEAHLVETWGATFRTEFQLLATYRQQLLEASEGQLRTLLLSATTSADCVDLLQQLFSEDGHFSSIQANQMRPELSYWFSVSRSLAERKKRVREAIRYLPRPMILYTTRKDHAREWYEILKQDGFKRMKMFTGDTPVHERRRLMSAWSRNEFDVMIATSAFGLGVDKGDIRTIVHACLPENIDRFYQEVGRAGRDGCSAISLMCMAQDDTDTAFGIQSRERITTEKALERWQGMRQNATLSSDKGNVLLVDMDAPPRDKPEMMQGERNQDWNWHTILLMQRARMLNLLNPRSELPLQYTSDGSEEKELATRLEVELLVSHLEEDQVFIDNITETIDGEKQKIYTSIHELKDLIKGYVSGNQKQCIAYEFAHLYPGTALACGGCPVCREQGHPPYANSPCITTDLVMVQPSSSFDLHSDVQRRMRPHRTMHVLWDGIRDTSLLDKLNALLVDLLDAGFQQYILDCTLIAKDGWFSELIKKLKQHHTMSPHLLLSDEWVLASTMLPLSAIPTVIVYPPDDDRADRLYRVLQQRLDAGVPRINIIAPTLYLVSERGYFKDRVNGLSQTTEALSTFLARINEEEYF